MSMGLNDLYTIYGVSLEEVESFDRHIASRFGSPDEQNLTIGEVFNTTLKNDFSDPVKACAVKEYKGYTLNKREQFVLAIHRGDVGFISNTDLDEVGLSQKSINNFVDFINRFSFISNDSVKNNLIYKSLYSFGMDPIKKYILMYQLNIEEPKYIKLAKVYKEVSKETLISFDNYLYEQLLWTAHSDNTILNIINESINNYFGDMAGSAFKKSLVELYSNHIG